MGGKRAGNNSVEIINKAADICRRLFAGGIMDIDVSRELIAELVENHIDAHGYHSDWSKALKSKGFSLKEFSMAATQFTNWKTNSFITKWLLHYNHDKTVSVYVVNSRLPVYRAYYGDGFGSTIAGLFTRMSPKMAPLAKQLSMKAIDVIRDKGINAVGNLAWKAFSAAKDKIMSLVRKKPAAMKSVVKPPVLPSTIVMPAKISKGINSAVEKKLVSLAASVAPSP